MVRKLENHIDMIPWYSIYFHSVPTEARAAHLQCGQHANEGFLSPRAFALIPGLPETMNHYYTNPDGMQAIIARLYIAAFRAYQHAAAGVARIRQTFHFQIFSYVI
jgi:hypothetical protein